MAKRSLAYGECARCGDGDLSNASGTSTLVGGYRTSLCLGCQNTFELFMRHQPTYLVSIDLEDAIVMAVALTNADGTDRTGIVGNLRLEQLKNLDQLHELSRAFVEDYKDA